MFFRNIFQTNILHSDIILLIRCLDGTDHSVLRLEDHLNAEFFERRSKHADYREDHPEKGYCHGLICACILHVSE